MRRCYKCWCKKDDDMIVCPTCYEVIKYRLKMKRERDTALRVLDEAKLFIWATYSTNEERKEFLDFIEQQKKLKEKKHERKDKDSNNGNNKGTHGW